jgi:2'-5' RNA ligase
MAGQGMAGEEGGMSLFHPTPDELWGKPCLAYHVQPGFAPGAQDRLHELQQRIVSLWPEPLLAGPPESLHVTIYPLVPVPGGFDKEAHWRVVAEPSRAILRDLCRDAPALTLRFDRLKVTPVGIIAAATDETGLITAIRQKVLDLLPAPPGRQHVHYDLVHTTLMRYRSAAPVPASAVERIETLAVSVDAPVDRIRLFRETLFPCLAGQELEAFRLRPVMDRARPAQPTGDRPE